jgi:hypothetical protein
MKWTPQKIMYSAPGNAAVVGMPNGLVALVVMSENDDLLAQSLLGSGDPGARLFLGEVVVLLRERWLKHRFLLVN